MRIGILASGNGTNAQAIINAINDGRLDASVELIIANRPDARVMERAACAGIAHLLMERKSFSDRATYDKALAEILQKHGCDLIVLAGYMLLLGSAFLAAFPDRVVNIHPALLPAFPGTDGIADSLAYGVRITGVSVHFVEEQMDSGPLIIQAALPIRQGEKKEDLARRIHAMEHRIFPQALQWFAEERISRKGRQVLLAPADRRQVKPDGDWLVWPPLEEGF